MQDKLLLLLEPYIFGPIQTIRILRFMKELRTDWLKVKLWGTTWY